MYIKWKTRRWETKTPCPFEIPPETHAVDEHVGLGFREGHTPHTQARVFTYGSNDARILDNNSISKDLKL